MKYLLVLFLLVSFEMAFSQHITIAKINDFGKIEFTEKSKRAVKIAYMRSFNDGRKLDSAYIDKIGQVKYLILLGSKSNIKSKSALSISIENNLVSINQLLSMTSCSNGACTNCNFFTENNKVVACKCESNGAISNNCTFKMGDGKYFYEVVNKILAE